MRGLKDRGGAKRKHGVNSMTLQVFFRGMSRLIIEVLTHCDACEKVIHNRAHYLPEWAFWRKFSMREANQGAN
jgi:hypothetical protein